MASNTYTLKSASYDGRYLELTCTQEQNLVDNTSTIKWTLASKGGSVPNYSTGPTTVKINGVQVWYKARTSYTTKAFPAALGSTSGTIVVPHNTDGSKSIAVSLSTAIYNASVGTKSGTWELVTNPRGASLVSANNFTDEENPVITLSNPSKAEVLAFICAENNVNSIYVGGKTVNKDATSFTFTLTEEERKRLRNAITNGETLPVSFYLKSLVGGEWYVSKPINKTMSLINFEPIVSIDIRDNNPDTVALTGNSSRLIRGYSTAYFTITAEGRKEATITEYYCAVNRNDVVEERQGAFLNVDTARFDYGVTDSRGYVFSDVVIPEFVEYFNISCFQEPKIQLLGETNAQITFKLEGFFFNDTFGNVQNELILEARYKSDYGDYGNWIPLLEAGTPVFNEDSSYTFTTSIVVPSYADSYTVQCRARDKLSESVTTEYKLKLVPVFDWGEHDFKFNVPVKFNGGYELFDLIIDTGTIGIWDYRVYANGVAECWGRLQVTTDIKNKWGSLFTSGILEETNIVYPIEFLEAPTLTVSLSTRSAGAMVMVPGGAGSATESNTQTGVFELVRGTELNGGVYVLNYHALGRWKWGALG